jgi:hypothetical protein
VRSEGLQKNESGKAGKGCTKESILQPLETIMDLAVSCMPDAKFCIVLLVVALPEIK